MKLGSVMKSTSVNILFQISSRLFTFILNAFILRYVSKEALGIMNVRLLLLYTSVQFISREPFRRSCASLNTRDGTTCESKGDADSKNKKKDGAKNKQDWGSTVNLIWLNAPLCIVVSFIFYFIWTLIVTPPDDQIFNGYNLAVILMLTSILVEMTGESLIIYSLSIDNYRVKLRSESASFILRCILIASGAIFFDVKNILIVFAFSHFLSSAIYVFIVWISYYGYRDENIKTLSDFLPKYFSKNFWIKTSPDGSSEDRKLEAPKLASNQYSLTFSFLSQTIIKQLLTEGEKFFMTFFDPLSFADQGMYEMVNNLASLASRFILAPIEESAFLIFSKIIDRHANQYDSEDGDTGQEKETERLKRRKTNLASDKDSAHDQKVSRIILSNLIKLMILFGSLILIFGVNFSKLLLLIYAGRSFIQDGAKIAIAPLLLKYQCVYVLVISINGIAECFSFASMTKNRLASFNKILIALSLFYLITSYLLCNLFRRYSLASLGFVIANIINMSVRVLYHLVYIRNYFKRPNAEEKLASQNSASVKIASQNSASDQSVIKSFLPSRSVLISCLIIFLMLYISDNALCCQTLSHTLLHLIIGAILFIIHLVIIYVNEKELINFLKEQFVDKNKTE